MGLISDIRKVTFAIHVHMIFCQEFREINYNILNGLRVSGSYRSLSTTETTISCAAECEKDTSCVSANYNNALNLCELNAFDPMQEAASILEDGNWKIIYLVDRKYGFVLSYNYCSVLLYVFIVLSSVIFYLMTYTDDLVKLILTLTLVTWPRYIIKSYQEK